MHWKFWIQISQSGDQLYSDTSTYGECSLSKPFNLQTGCPTSPYVECSQKCSLFSTEIFLQISSVSERRQQNPALGRRIRFRGVEAGSWNFRGIWQDQRQRLSRDDDVRSRPAMPLLASRPPQVIKIKKLFYLNKRDKIIILYSNNTQCLINDAY